MEEVGLSGKLGKISGATRFFDDRVSGGSFLMHHRLPWMKPGGVKGNFRAAAFLVHCLLRHRMRTFELEDRPYLDQTPPST